MSTGIFFTLFFTGTLIMGLIKDFQKDKGLNKKAKVFQTICLVIIFLMYSSSIRSLSWLVRNFDKAKERFSVDVGMFSGQVHFFIFLLALALSLTVLILAFLMSRRNQKARRLLFYFLPVLALTEMFSFFRGWISEGGDFDLHPGLIFLIALIIFGGFTTVILLIYNSKFMKEFFNFKLPAPTENDAGGAK